MLGGSESGVAACAGGLTRRCMSVYVPSPFRVREADDRIGPALVLDCLDGSVLRSDSSMKSLLELRAVCSPSPRAMSKFTTVS